MRTSNPALNEKSFRSLETVNQNPMTLEGAINKSIILISLLIIGAIFSWYQAYPGGWTKDLAPTLHPLHFVGSIGALILAFVIIFKQNLAPYLAPVYAILEGVLLGSISAVFEYRYPGIVFQAVLGTAGVFAALLMVYKSGLIKVTDNFRLGVLAATGGVAILYLISFVMSFFGTNIPYIHEGGMIGIGFSLVVIVIASLNLVLDFDFIEQGAASRRMPKYMEWYAAFGLLITLVWLYLEILRLIAKSRK